MSEFVSVLVVVAVVLLLGRQVKRRWGEWTIACAVRQHDICSYHLSCPCPHHDAVIHEAMAESK